MRICSREGFASNWLKLRLRAGLKNLNYGIAAEEGLFRGISFLNHLKIFSMFGNLLTMKRLLTILFLAFFLLTFLISPFAQEKPSWSAYFSPRGGCTEAIVKELGRAKSTVLVQALIVGTSGLCDLFR